MATVKRRRRHARETALLTTAQEFNLLIGSPADAFPNEEARRRAWMQNREALLASDPDGRPHAWVCYEGGGFLPSEGGRIRLALVRLGICPPTEGELMQRSLKSERENAL